MLGARDGAQLEECLPSRCLTLSLFPSTNKPGLLAHVCHRGSRKVDAGRPEVQSHPFIMTLSQKNKVLNSSKVACVVCLSLHLLHSLVTKETEQKPACINHPAADLRLLMNVTKA